MERSPRRISNEKNVVKEANEIFDFIFRNAFGPPVILTSAPTNAQMKANTWGISGTTLYVKFVNNVTLSFAGTNVA